MPGDDPRSAAAEAGGRKDEPPQERQGAQRHDEEHDGPEEPEIALEEAGIGDARLALGPAAKLALEAPLPALPAPVRIGGAQALGPGADHVLLLRDTARDRVLR